MNNQYNIICTKTIYSFNPNNPMYKNDPLSPQRRQSVEQMLLYALAGRVLITNWSYCIK